ncbi:RNA polymerase sigma factor [Flavihumibacter fluvii]|uniref:RNA polymerase sigma factor n=1 Tax=Flavihumibacter fluvii TaxID=2838157 RepID=UPI001BDE699E|nr:DUF6596 domain-containing protein [Flavihumibacter fluvii]ULQ54668.1 RNA polymerase subunit sigma [Flavihumibacter fluvii]
MQHQELIPHLFRSEFSKITAVLCKLMGIEQLAAAEDIASETFLAAFENWPYSGIPPNPQAWLYTVAKNKAMNYLHRHALFNGKVLDHLVTFSPESTEPDIDLSDQNISDSQLQMLFAICHPAISTEAQIGLALRVLCGFGIEEIAYAFLTNKETISKRLFRAREKLRHENIPIEFPPDAEINSRLGTILTTLYLLFNEGYYSESRDIVLRNDLCLEAMRLTYLLVDNGLTESPPVYALLALMCFHSSRFAARQGQNGEMVLYDDQDESLWNAELISRGVYYLQKASQGNILTKYHLEAGIAYWHTQKADTIEKWESILQLHNHLLVLEYSPIAALNRTYALSKVKGKMAGITAAEELGLVNNPFYFTLLGELYSGIDNETARRHFKKALILANSNANKAIIQKKIDRFHK